MKDDVITLEIFDFDAANRRFACLISQP